MKCCTFCKIEKPKSDFYKNKKNSDGLQSRCKDCAKAAVIAWQKRNPEKVNKKISNWKQKTKAWLSPKARAYTKHKHARRKTQTPLWSDQKAVLDFYLKCPSGYHVDHIIPLRGTTVSGLHVIENLQYLPAIENLKKGNRY